MAIILRGGDATVGVDGEGRAVAIVALHPESAGGSGGGGGSTDPLVEAALGTPADATATSDGGTFSIIALIKRGLANWTTLLAKIPALVNGGVPTVTLSGSVYAQAATPVFAIATASTAVTVAPANAARKSFMLQNSSTGDLWFAFGVTAVIGGAGQVAATARSFKLAAGLLYEPQPGMCTNQSISIVGATVGQTFQYQEC